SWEGAVVERSSELIEEARKYKAELVGHLFAAEAEVVAFRAELAVDATPLARRVPTAGNVVGVGYGAKVVDGRLSTDVALRVYVRTKLARGDLSPGELVPGEVNGCVTDVVPVGDVVAFARPVRCGVSVGHKDITAGTLGCLVRREGDADTYILSNNHVLANVNQAELGDPILEPGPADGGTSPIAELADFEPIKLWGGANEIDGAVARVLHPGDVLPEIEVIGHVQNPPVPGALYQSVRKHGRTSNHTVGVIVDVSADLWVRVLPQAQAWFEEQLAVVGAGGAFSQPGDSGSLVVDGVSRAPVGLLFAGGRDQTFVNPIDPVLARFAVAVIE
ncbi:MAG: hypothetical protein ACRDJN_25580, partial [Chloroflexota bacterium]